MRRIYLDNNATTGLDPQVLEAMLQELSPTPSNPSSVHYFGQQARHKLQNARQTVASFFRVRPEEVLFTSGGTEALNLLLRGHILKRGPCHILSSNVEHASVYRTLQSLATQGCLVDYLPAGLWGAVHPHQIASSLRKDTGLIVLGAANSETGVKHDLDQIAEIARQRNVPLVIDGVALLGKEPFAMPQGVAAMAFSAHKFHGPKGTGCALVRATFPLLPLLTGGDQEFSRRAGTENLPGIVGLAKALQCIESQLPAASHRMQELRTHFEQELLARLEPVLINGQGPRVVNTSNLCFPGADGETLLMQLDLAGIAASHGSACASGALEPSRVLTQMGLPSDLARSSLRFSLSRLTTREEIDRTLDTLVRLVSALRR